MLFVIREEKGLKVEGLKLEGLKVGRARGQAVRLYPLAIFSISAFCFQNLPSAMPIWTSSIFSKFASAHSAFSFYLSGFFLGEADELGRPERDFVGVEREQGFGGTILEGRDDLGHGIEHAVRHWPGHWGDEGVGNFHGVGVGVIG